MSGISGGPISSAPIAGGSTAPSAVVYEEDLASASSSTDGAIDYILPALRASLTGGDGCEARSLHGLAERVVAHAGVAAFRRMEPNAADGGSMSDAIGAAWYMLLQDEGAVADTAEATTIKLAAIAEVVAALCETQGRRHAYVAVATAAVLEGRVAGGFAAEAIDQAELADETQSIMRAMLAAAETIGAADGAAGSAILSLLAQDGAVVDAQTSASARLNATLESGGVAYATLRIGGSDYSGWVFNTDLRAVTEYRNVPFDSFAILNGRTYAASENGIFELTGDTDDGAPIDAWFRPFLSNFGTHKLKRVTDIWIGTNATSMYVKVHTRDPKTGLTTADIYPLQHAHGPGTGKGRTKVGRGLCSDWWGLTVGNVAGADFEVDSIEWKLLVLDRRQ